MNFLGKRHRDQELRSRLLREARLLSRLNHPNICQIHDLLEGEERDYLVLELITGRTLGELIREGVAEDHQLALAEQIVVALAAAHEQGIVHLDLKPENIMVSPQGDGDGGTTDLVVWDVALRTRQIRLDDPHSGRTASLAWSRDGRRLFSGGTDGTIRIHDFSGGPEPWRQHACRRAGRNLTGAEWKTYMGSDVPYRLTCPEYPPNPN